jgi:hypothetical protein
MKPSQAFGIVVRALGLLGWVGSFFYLVSTVVAFVSPNYRPGIYPWWHYFVSGAVLFSVGWVLLRGADRFVAFAYPSRGSDAPDV